jgi:Rha family phage regulatory protein
LALDLFYDALWDVTGTDEPDVIDQLSTAQNAALEARFAALLHQHRDELDPEDLADPAGFSLRESREMVDEHNRLHPDDPFTDAELAAIAPDLLAAPMSRNGITQPVRASIPELCRDLGVKPADGVPLVSSVDVAGKFERRHKHVLDAIKDLLISRDVGSLGWFREACYRDPRGREQPAYDMTRDGLVLLVMPWAGSKALAFKIRYIQAFNAMEDALRHPQPLSRAKTRYQAEQMLLEWNEAEIAAGLPRLPERRLFTEYGPRLVAEHPEMLPAIAGEWLHDGYQGMLRRERHRIQTFDHPVLPGFVGSVALPGLCTVIRDGAEIAVPRERLTYAETVARLGHRYRRRGGLNRWQHTTWQQDRALVAEYNLLHPDQPITAAVLDVIAPDLLGEAARLQ